MGVDDRDRFGLYDHEFESLSTCYSAISGDLTSGVYLLSEGNTAAIVGTAVCRWLGGFDGLLKALVVFMAVDS